jgi:hypothetical protein
MRTKAKPEAKKQTTPKLGRPVGADGPRLHKLVSLFTTREFSDILDAAREHDVPPRTLVRMALNRFGVSVDSA